MNYLQKRLAAFGYAFKGIACLFEEPHALIHLVATIGVIIAGILFKISMTEWAVISLCIGSVFGAEAMNTAIEKLGDKISSQKDPYIGAAKDLAAASVLILAMASIGVAAFIFIPKF